LSRVARMLAISVIVLAAALGLAFGLLLPSVARADDPPPPTTIPTPTLPEPDPAPAPKPKPAPKPAPKSTSAPRVSHAPTYQAPVTPAPSTRPAATVKPKARAYAKPRPKKVRHKKVVMEKETTSLPSGSFNLGSLLVVLGLSLAIACLAVAVVPATYVKWRPAAIFVSERQVDLTVIGLGLLVVTAFMLVLTKGP